MDKVALPFPLLAFTTSVPALGGVFDQTKKSEHPKDDFEKVPQGLSHRASCTCLGIKGLDVAVLLDVLLQFFVNIFGEVSRQKKIAKKDFHQSNIFKTRLPL